jgi:glycosyltransferase involved in cell wall biosynthesis
LIVIPAFNEQGVIGKVVSDLYAQSLPCIMHVLVVDDGSSDDTAIQAEQAGARVISLVENLGYGYALQTGYRFAMEQGYDFVVQMDGDGQHAVESVAGLIRPIIDCEADLVIGSRALSHISYPMPLARRLGQKLFSCLLSNLSDLQIGDPTSGFQSLNRSTLKYYLTDDFPGDYPDANVLLYLYLHGSRILEVPAIFRVNERGTSMHNGFLKPLFYVYKMLLSMLLIYMRYRRPQMDRTND